MKNGVFVALVVALVSTSSYFFLLPKNQKEIIRDYKNATYRIENREITLKDGFSEIEIVSGSASKLITRYFGNEAYGDLNGDGIMDVAFIITQDGGGSGTFFYGVVATKDKDGGYKGMDGVFLGDRIAPQSTEIKDGLAIFNYAERTLEQSMKMQASIGVSKYMKISDNSLVEANRFEGMVKVSIPTPNSLIKSPYKISGEARGVWYFEASFPIKLLDADGNQIGVSVAQAKGDWMTTAFVPFESEIKFSLPKTKTGTLVFIKDNPSGLPENDATFSVPVIFQ